MKDPKKITPKPKRRPVLIELPQPYIEQLAKVANKDNRSAKAQAEYIVMRQLDELFGNTQATPLS